MSDGNQRPDAAPLKPAGERKPRPEELDPDLAAAVMAKQLIDKLGKPTISSKKLNTCHALAKTLTDNKIYDASLRVKLFEEFAADGVNDKGLYFERIWAYLMKPKYVITGMPYQGQPEEKRSLLDRAREWWNGGSNNAGNGTPTTPR